MQNHEWDLFDIFDAREDNYTNMLHFLYETEANFRARFLKLIFGKDVDGVIFKTRTAYHRDNEGKDIPDIILYNDNHLAIIEVKLFSDEGYQQTDRYYKASKRIMKELAIDEGCTTAYWFLTLSGTKPHCLAFKKLLWSNVSECMNPSECSNEMAQMLMSQFKERIKSIEQREITLDGLWEEQVHSYRWSGAVRFYSALKLLFDQIDKEEWYGVEKWTGYYWTGFNPASNSYAHSALFYPADGNWQGKELKKAMEDNDESGCYDYHFEFEWDEAKNLLTLRLDSHLNPYKSQNDIKNMDNKELKEFAKKCNNKRAEKAREMKTCWIQMAPEEYRKSYNAHITSALMTLVTVKYTHNKLKDLTVKDVLDLIRPFIETGVKFMKKNFNHGD